MRAVHNVNDCDTELDASSGSSRYLLFRMLCNVTRPPPSSIEQEDDPRGFEVRCKVGDIVGGIVSSDLFWRQRRDFIFKIFLWEDRLRVGFGHVTSWRGWHDPLLAWRGEPRPKGVVLWTGLCLLPVLAFKWFRYSLVYGSI